MVEQIGHLTSLGRLGRDAVTSKLAIALCPHVGGGLSAADVRV